MACTESLEVIVERCDVEQLTAFAAPAFLEVEDDKERIARPWVVRLKRPISDRDVEPLSAELTAFAVDAIADAQRQRGLPSIPAARQPIVRVHHIDDLHVVVAIRTARLENDQAEAHLVAPAAVLRRLDEKAEIDDIQGIPIRFLARSRRTTSVERDRPDGWH